MECSLRVGGASSMRLVWPTATRVDGLIPSRFRKDKEFS